MLNRLRENCERVEEQIAEAARTSGRSRNDVRLVAITKSVGPEIAAMLVEQGCRDLGESRPQGLWEKATSISRSDVRWHLVGPLQRNKIRKTIPLATLIHSVDSFRLADAIDRIAVEMRRTVDVLVEVNVSREPSKHGLAVEQVADELSHMGKLSAVRVRGLMCISGLRSDAAQKREEFARLRELRERLQRIAPHAKEFTELSMGMSDDFEIAIQEGATIVRLGSILFRGLAG